MKRGAPTKEERKENHSLRFLKSTWELLKKRADEYQFESVTAYVEYCATAYVAYPEQKPKILRQQLCSKCGKRKRDGRMADRTLCIICGKKRD
jgi:hypothetical protein